MGDLVKLVACERATGSASQPIDWCAVMDPDMPC